MQKELHCGACNKKFDDVNKLIQHIDKCPEAHCLLPLIHLVSFGGDGLGHPVAHFIWGIKKAIKNNLIKKYAFAVADDLDVLVRAKLHKDLCDTLEIPYKSFRPFESSSIIEKMDRSEALKYLCEEIFSFANKLRKD